MSYEEPKVAVNSEGMLTTSDSGLTFGNNSSKIDMSEAEKSLNEAAKELASKAYVDKSVGSVVTSTSVAPAHNHSIGNHTHTVNTSGSIGGSYITWTGTSGTAVSLPELELEEPVDGLKRAREAVVKRLQRLEDELKSVAEKYNATEEELQKVALVLDQYDKLIDLAESGELDPEENDEEPLTGEE